jgi:hypothetical protein
MSRPLRIALVAEGVTDFEVLNAAIEVMLGNRPFEIKLLQPEGSVAFGSGDAGGLEGGWKGVYRWCLQAAQRGEGALSGDPLFLHYDLLLLHLDADVANEDPVKSKLPAGIGLPCEQPYPPPESTTADKKGVGVSS